MTRDELAARFPKLKIGASSPPMFRLNGCGMALYGSRDHDAETGTYVATLCLCLVFVPIMSLKAYRVARAQRGWYFIGSEPLSKFAKLWNLSLVAGIIALIVGTQFDSYRSSPSYKAKQQMALAHKAVGEGHLADAALIYQTQIATLSDQAVNATNAIKGLMDNDCKHAPLSESKGVYASLAKVARDKHVIPGSDVADAAMKLVADKGDADPRNGVAVLDAVRPLVVDTRPLDARRLVLLQKAAANEPANLEVIVPLASLLADQHRGPEAKKLLLPVKNKLSDGEGARVLGTILGAEGDYDGAYALLWPYVKTRLDSFHNAEKNYTDTVQRLDDRELDLLRNEKAPQSFYDQLNAASKPQRDAMIREYIDARLKNDPSLIGAQEAMEREISVVPVALELGMVMLQRAQAIHESEARKAELQSAEQVFLAIGGVAGQSDEYRLSLGQVDYWLGKQADGRKLFDDFLSTKGRTFQSLMQIASRLRELGVDSETRALAEEAYKKAGSAEERYQGANLRALCFKDTDDRIDWLNKSDTASPTIKAELAQANGLKAFADGHDDEAARQFQISADAYNAMPRSATTLNQTALAYSAIFRANGDRAALERCIDNFQQAVELSPADSILLYNAGDTLIDAALSDVAGKEIDLHALHETGNFTLLAHLYTNETDREIIIKRVKDHPGIARGLGYLNKAMVLSPRSARSYAAVDPIHQFTKNDPALIDLLARLKAADLDTSDQLARQKDFYSGVRDQKDTATTTASVRRCQDLAAKVRPVGGVTASVAVEELADAMMALDLFTDDVDAEKVAALMQEADTLHSSALTQNGLISGELFRAAKRLSGGDAAFAEFYRKYRRSVGLANLMTVALSEPSSFQKRVAADPDVQKATAILIEQGRRFPKDRSGYEWAWLKAVNPAEAEKAADTLRHDPRTPVVQSIMTLLAPADANTALETNWLMALVGKSDDGKAALQKVAGMGVPMPEMH
ncbi:MAG TPA: hypothetical protein VFE47_00220 [Tepidisphaeraceae bacterium]|jgi:hypothetical protein|nr:hypothetical protein [Tepidisphaeraceae bacterium]